MKTTTKIDYNERLIILANYIKHIELNPKMLKYGVVHLCLFSDDGRDEHTVKYPYWVFEELPHIFHEWYFDKEQGIPLLSSLGYHDETCSGIFDYFSLCPFEFIHLFSLDGYQDTQKYGGKELNFSSSGKDIADNIYEFVKRRRSKFQFKFSLN